MSGFGGRDRGRICLHHDDGPCGTLYIGVTNNLLQRVWQHRNGEGSDFCRQHGLKRLVFAEPHATIADAILREKALKKWKRAWKLNLIGQVSELG